MQISTHLRRLRLAALLLAVGLTAAGCWPESDEPAAVPPRHGRDPVEREYEPPAAGPAPASSAIVAEQPHRALARIASRLGSRGFAVTPAPDGSTRLIVQHGGDAEPYLDCGSFVLPDRSGGAASRVAAARSQTDIPSLPLERNESQRRQLRLDARIIVSAAPSGNGSELIALSTYVVTRRVDHIASDGSAAMTSRETISLGTADLGRFPMGLECIATGRLEAAILGLELHGL